MLKKIVVLVIILLILLTAGFFAFNNYIYQQKQIGNKEVDTPAVETNLPNTNQAEIELSTPTENEIITSPLSVKGMARGSWFFEGSFPVILTNWDGLIIAQTNASAVGEWMTEDFVPFEAVIEFDKPNYGKGGILILKKDNPSGLPENDDAVEITVFFE